MAEPDPQKHVILTCKGCGHKNEFSQPYPYHAGFGNMGFLYNEGGDLTLTWNAYDPYFKKLFPQMLPWTLNPTQRKQLETILPISPKGDRWLFSAPARCLKCKAPISEPMEPNIYYLIYPDSIELDWPGKGELWLESYCAKSG